MSQSTKLINQIIRETKDRLDKVIQSYKIDAVGYIPPTLSREIQIMKELKVGYNLSLPIIEIQKVKSAIVIPQKSLSKLSDRIDNAQISMQIVDTRVFKNVLLIDDALGSGATLNEAARKIKDAQVSSRVYGFAITGSYKGFEVLSEA